MVWIIHREPDGSWGYAHGGEFPNERPIPLWSKFRRMDVGTDYEWNGTAWVAESGGGGNDLVVRQNSGADVGQRPRLNFIEGANITLTIADDAGDDEVDITIASSGGAGGADQDAQLYALFWAN